MVRSANKHKLYDLDWLVDMMCVSEYLVEFDAPKMHHRDGASDDVRESLAKYLTGTNKNDELLPAYSVQNIVFTEDEGCLVVELNNLQVNTPTSSNSIHSKFSHGNSSFYQ
jgi:hypothetical protein